MVRRWSLVVALVFGVVVAVLGPATASAAVDQGTYTYGTDGAGFVFNGGSYTFHTAGTAYQVLKPMGQVGTGFVHVSPGSGANASAINVGCDVNGTATWVVGWQAWAVSYDWGSGLDVTNCTGVDFYFGTSGGAASTHAVSFGLWTPGAEQTGYNNSGMSVVGFGHAKLSKVAVATGATSVSVHSSLAPLGVPYSSPAGSGSGIWGAIGWAVGCYNASGTWTQLATGSITTSGTSGPWSYSGTWALSTGCVSVEVQEWQGGWDQAHTSAPAVSFSNSTATATPASVQVYFSGEVCLQKPFIGPSVSCQASDNPVSGAALGWSLNGSPMPSTLGTDSTGRYSMSQTVQIGSTVAIYLTSVPYSQVSSWSPTQWSCHVTQAGSCASDFVGRLPLADNLGYWQWDSGGQPGNDVGLGLAVGFLSPGVWVPFQLPAGKWGYVQMEGQGPATVCYNDGLARMLKCPTLQPGQVVGPIDSAGILLQSGSGAEIGNTELADEVGGTATPVATYTVVPTATATPYTSVAVEVNATPTATPNLGATATAQALWTATATATPDLAGTATAYAWRTATAVAAVTGTAYAYQTATAQARLSPTPTATVWGNATATAVSVATQTAVAGATQTAVSQGGGYTAATATAQAQGTATAAAVATQTAAPIATQTAAAIATAVASGTPVDWPGTTTEGSCGGAWASGGLGSLLVCLFVPQQGISARLQTLEGSMGGRFPLVVPSLVQNCAAPLFAVGMTDLVIDVPMAKMGTFHIDVQPGVVGQLTRTVTGAFCAVLMVMYLIGLARRFLFGSGE